MKNFAILVLVALCGLFSIEATAQIKTPSASPTQSTELTVGLTDIAITYSRPSMKGRTIFATDGLVPLGKVWRLGANSATKLEFSDDVKLGGAALKAGAYAVLAKPGANSWEFMFFPYEKGSWSSYLEKTPVATATATPTAFPMAIETFMIDVNNISGNAAAIDFAWEKTLVSLPLEVEVDARVEAAIAKTMAGPAQGDYHTAATYYHENGKDLNQALAWSKMANAKDPKFWQVRREALIRAEMKDYAGAITAAKLSRELAVKADYAEYIRLNDNSIKEWSAMLGEKAAPSRMKKSLKKANKMK